jgi:mRNA-degrading endonuclease toxin of MazEF toxin-antitoxin module
MSKGLYKYQRGEVYLVEEHQVQGHEQRKTRWWVLVGVNPINLARGTVISIPLSTQAPVRPPLSIEVYFNNTKLSAVIDQVRALDKKRFLHCDGILSSHEMSLIDDGLRQVLGL